MNIQAIQKSALISNSKKGFTLVELIVTITVLVIIAAIAIPSVISIIGSSEESRGNTDAQTVESACKSFYVAVAGGQITSETFTAEAGSTMVVPSKNAPGDERKKDADTATVADACKYCGISTDVLKNLYYVDTTTSKYKRGQIIYLKTKEAHTKQIGAATKLSVFCF